MDISPLRNEPVADISWVSERRSSARRKRSVGGKLPTCWAGPIHHSCPSGRASKHGDRHTGRFIGDCCQEGAANSYLIWYGVVPSRWRPFLGRPTANVAEAVELADSAHLRDQRVQVCPDVGPRIVRDAGRHRSSGPGRIRHRGPAYWTVDLYAVVAILS